MVDTIKVELVYALPDEQFIETLELPAGATVSDVVARSALGERYPKLDLGSLATGIWGRVVPASAVVAAGDRVELYRPLITDPREARRQRAARKGR